MAGSMVLAGALNPYAGSTLVRYMVPAMGLLFLMLPSARIDHRRSAALAHPEISR